MAASLHVEGCRCTRCIGFEAGNQLAVAHGATSSRRIGPVAANHRRRVLRRLRLSPSDLDAIGRGHLDLYVRSIARLDLMDAYAAEHGWIGEDGAAPSFSAFYTACMNGARQSLSKLEQHLRQRVALDPLDVLEGEGRRLRLAAEDEGRAS